MADEYTFTISTDEHSEEVTVPAAPVDIIADEDQDPADAAADFLVMLLAQQMHGAVHHSRGDPPEEIAQAEEDIMPVFEERFGATFGEVTGHDH